MEYAPRFSLNSQYLSVYRFKIAIVDFTFRNCAANYAAFVDLRYTHNFVLFLAADKFARNEGRGRIILLQLPSFKRRLGVLTKLDIFNGKR